MNPLEERLNRLETRVTHYRNFNILLCLMLVTIVTVAATDDISPFQTGSIPDPIAMPKGNVGVPDLPNEDIPAVMYPDAHRAGKVAAQTQDVIRTRRLEIVNDAGEVVVKLVTSTKGAGLIFVNSAEDKNLITMGPSASGGHGLVLINSTEEKNVIALLGSNSGDGFIQIRNRNEELLISLNTDESDGRIRIKKTGNKNLAYLGANTSGNGLLKLSNNSGKGLVSMSAHETAGNLRLLNNNDKTIAYLGTDVGGEGILRINSKTGTELIILGSNREDDGLLRVSNRYGTLGVALIAAKQHGLVRTTDAQDNILAELTATTGGNGLVRTLSPEGITTWSSNSVQVNTGSTSSLKGDIDNDGDIDGDDFLIFSENFGKKR